ncbi:hypothetical protein SLS56_005242 [Neofusicoccum ribis]|uniref:A-kinase anchor protein 7-like phosphoesterase domain-containing protein n=1 Tax=Neofusicoccum ribis TaxID=45134 RepID=A0ABR3SUC7_9PEZI
MPRRGVGKRKGGYKGPVPGPGMSSEGATPSSTPQKPGKRPPLTHFLCLPLVTAESKPQLQASLDRFKTDVLRPKPNPKHDKDTEVADGVPVEGSDGPAVPARAIRPVGTLHLTLGVMSLVDPERIHEAVSLLQSLDLAAMPVEGMRASQSAAKENKSHASEPEKPMEAPELEAITSESPAVAATDLPTDVTTSPSKPLVISLRSLVSMHPPHKTSILYAQPEDPTNRIHAFCDALRNLFTERGLMIEDTRPLKLHATVVNTIYAKSGGRYGKGKGRSQGFVGTPNELAARDTATVDALSGGTSVAPLGTSTGHGPNARAPIQVDATALIARYADFVWANEIWVGKVAICKMGAKKVLDAQGNVESEEYEEVGAAEMKF